MMSYASHRSVATDTLQVAFYDEHPDASVTPLVFLHGGGLDRRMWRHQLRAFEDRRVLVPDARNHGLTQPLATDLPHRACDDVIGLLDGLDIEQAVLVGLSMGGGTAVDVALEHPDRVSGLVVSGAGTSEPDFQDPWVLDILTTWHQTQAAGDADGWVEAFMRFLPGPHRTADEVDADITAQVEAMVRDTLSNHLTVDDDGVPIPPTPPQPVTETWKRLPGIEVPVLVLLGGIDADDHLRMGRTLAESVANGSVHIVDGTAHYPNLERPEEFNAAIAEYLARSAL